MYIELKHINKSFGDFQASKDVNFGIEKGKLVRSSWTIRKWKDNDSPNACRAGASGFRRYLY